MKIKTKLTLGVGLLFVLIVLLSLVGSLNIHALKSDTTDILTANYNSLQYCRTMLDVLESDEEERLAVFESQLRLQEQNITETGEAEVTQALRTHFQQYTTGQDSAAAFRIRRDLFQIMDMNIQAIERKSKVAAITADKAVFWIAVSGTLCFVIAFVLLVNLPSNIADPIGELTDSIRQIAAENYAERVNFESHSEFGQLAASFNTMAQKLQEYNSSNLAKLMMEKKRIETLIENMHDPVIGLDEHLNLIFANEKAVSISGLRKEELLGKNARDLALQNDLIRSFVRDIAADETSSPQAVKPVKIYSENKESYFEKETLRIVITPTGERTQRLVGHVILLRNVTAYKELDFAKTNFIATVSHEFKTPIASIRMSLQLLENEQTGPLNIEQKTLLESIGEDTARLLHITGELLDMTQLESGQIHLSLMPVKVAPILSQALNAVKNQADQKQVRLLAECPAELSGVMADEEKTAWVLTNLLTNAIRYSYENSDVYINAIQIKDKVHIIVRDHGHGIAPQYKDRIFDRYFRVPGATKEGTGLGLAISKEFMEAQGGTILLESELGKGSTFTMVLNAVQ
jgi:PAS domain S-box-containing protein